MSRENLDRVANFIIERDAKRAREATRAPERRCGAISGQGRYDSIDIPAWFGSHGLYRFPLDDYNGNPRHAVRCPWESEHTVESFDDDTSTVVFENPGRWPGFNCSHAHCAHRGIRDVMELLGDADEFCSERWRDEG